MSKIQIENIDSVTTNGNLKITPNGTGVLQVSGDNDSTLQLDNIKVKSPSASAAQDYTLTLPSNNLAADRYLKVDSITGSGSSAVGQVELEQIATPSASPLNGNNFNEGLVPTANFNLFGTSGGGYKLVSQSKITSGSVSNIQFTGLEANTSYRLVAKQLVANTSNYYLRFRFSLL